MIVSRRRRLIREEVFLDGRFHIFSRMIPTPELRHGRIVCSEGVLQSQLAVGHQNTLLIEMRQFLTEDLHKMLMRAFQLRIVQEDSQRNSRILGEQHMTKSDDLKNQF